MSHLEYNLVVSIPLDYKNGEVSEYFNPNPMTKSGTLSAAMKSE